MRIYKIGVIGYGGVCIGCLAPLGPLAIPVGTIMGLMWPYILPLEIINPKNPLTLSYKSKVIFLHQKHMENVFKSDL